MFFLNFCEDQLVQMMAEVNGEARIKTLSVVFELVEAKWTLSYFYAQQLESNQQMYKTSPIILLSLIYKFTRSAEVVQQAIAAL